MQTFLVVAIILLCSATLSLALPGLPVSFQVHSNNDLRLWPQALRKGTTWFKIDPHLLPGGQNFTGRPWWSPFVLNHDPPVAAQRYFTLQDLVEFLKIATPLPFPVQIALCFKAEGDLPPELVRAVVDGLNEAAAALPSTVLWVMDGAGSAMEFDGVSLGNWPSTWVGSAQDAHNRSSCLFSETGGCRNLDVLDMEAIPAPLTNITAWIGDFCQVGFGRFAKSQHPWLVWEPSDERSILDVIGSFDACGINHPAGLRFAINIDPQMFNVYSGPGRAVVPGWAASERPVIAPLSSEVGLAVVFGRSGYTFVAACGAPPSRAFCPVSGTHTYGKKSLSMRSMRSSPVCGYPDLVATVDSSLAGSCVLTCSAASGQCCERCVVGSELFVNSTGIWAPPAPEGMRTAAVALTRRAELLALGVPEAPTGEEPCPVALLRVGMAPLCPSAAAFQARPVLDGALVAVTGTTLVLAVVTTAGSDAFAVVFDLAGQGSVSGPVWIARGSAPSLSASGEVIALVLAKGYCFNSDYHNKRPSPLVCDAKPQASNFGLTYSVGSWSAGWQPFLARAASGAAASGVTPCDPGLLHGMYDQGTSPSALLFPVPRLPEDPVLPGSLDSVFALVGAHSSFLEGDVDTQGCGWPRSADESVVDTLIFASVPDGAEPLSTASLALSATARARDVKCDACLLLFEVLNKALLNNTEIEPLSKILEDTCPVTKFLWGEGGSEPRCRNEIATYVPDLISSVNGPPEGMCAQLGACNQGQQQQQGQPSEVILAKICETLFANLDRIGLVLGGIPSNLQQRCNAMLPAVKTLLV
jgi:hypothetical protein